MSWSWLRMDSTHLKKRILTFAGMTDQARCPGTKKAALFQEPPLERPEILMQTYMNFMNLSLASSMISRRSISRRAMG